MSDTDWSVIKWQPIETAPETPFDIILAEDGYVFVGGYDQNEQSWVDLFNFPMNPTHWMPLPPPPKDK